MDDGLRSSAESLSIDQLLAAISRIDSALEHADEGLQDSEEDESLMDRCAALEKRLEDEQSKRRQLELAYGSIISTTYELNKELVHMESAQRLRSELQRVERENHELAAELASTKQSYNHQIENLNKSLGKAKLAAALLDGNKEVLAKLTYSQLLSAEKQLLKALSILHEVKADSQARGEGSLCVICEERKLAVLLRPCNHVCTCEHCATALQSCPICRTKIASREKIFIQ